MGRYVRLIDFGVGVVVAVWVAVYIDAPWPVATAVSIGAGLAGVAWRHPKMSVGLTAGVTLVALRWVGVSGAGEWDVALFIVSAASLGAYVRLPFVGLGIVALALVVAWGERFDWGNLLFGTFLLGGVAALARLVAGATRRAKASRMQAERLAAATPEEIARRAVIEEQQRLATDVQRVVHRCSACRCSAKERPPDALSGLVSHRRRRTFVGNSGGISRGDRNRNTRLARLRAGPHPERDRRHRPRRQQTDGRRH